VSVDARNALGERGSRDEKDAAFVAGLANEIKRAPSNLAHEHDALICARWHMDRVDDILGRQTIVSAADRRP
jgi:hypothetical protein